MNLPILFLALLPAALGAESAVPLHGRFEAEVKNEKRYTNPFQDVALDAVFTSPSKRAVKFFGFHCQSLEEISVSLVISYRTLSRSLTVSITLRT
jgi:hypothetical protein